VLCFDGDKAGLRAAYRAIDRALPLLKPGRSFRFCLLSGGQDPDDVLREKGPLVLRDLLSQTRPFVEVLFQKERELEPLDTPERRAGMKQRLRQAANAVGDKDLAEQYRRQLLEGFDQLFPQQSPMQRDRAPWRKGGLRAPLGSTAEGKAAAAQLAGSLDPIAAAVVQGAIDDPVRLDDHLEAIQVHGFGDPALDAVAREIIRLRLEADSLDSEALKRHLAHAGLGASLREIERAALKSGAPFLSTDMTLADARVSWSQAFEVLTRLAALEIALDSAKSEAGTVFDAEAFMRLKAERDALKRAIKLGTIWTPAAS